MKKQLLIIGITLVLITVGLSGCSDNNLSSKSNDEKIIGRWTGTMSGTTQIMTFQFYSNGSFFNSVGKQGVWGTYAMTDTTLVGTSGGVTHTVEYSFSDNDNKLTFIETGGELFILLTRQ